MRIIFAMKETVMNRYSVEVPKKLENSSDEELLAMSLMNPSNLKKISI